MADHLTIDVRETEGASVLALAGELDLASSPLLSQRAEEIVAAGRSVVLDLRGLSFIDSTGLGAIAGIERSAEKAGVSLALVPGPRQVQRVFDVSGTAEAFTWTDAP